MSGQTPLIRIGTALAPGEAQLRDLLADRFASRLFARDDALWGEAAEAEAGQRLGWVDAHDRGEATVAEAESLRASFAADGLDRVVLCGMGGSSLAPAVIAGRDGAVLDVLDSTHPARIRRALLHLDRTVVVVSSKSGSTIETRSQLAAFEAAFERAGIDGSARIVVVTDPGSALQAHARDRGYRLFLSDPEVGGRYSALTAFGLVPAVLAGADGRALLREAAGAAELLRRDEAENPALRLAAALAAALPQRYVWELSEGPGDAIGLAEWIEQLVAESTGKQGRGILPIPGRDGAETRNEDPAPSTTLRIDLLVEPVPPREGIVEPIGLSAAASLGGHFLLWEVVTAALGRLLGVNPFDQPDVESAKVAARAALARADALEGPKTLSGAAAVSALRAAVPDDGYCVVQAYLDPAEESSLVPLSRALRRVLGVPVAMSLGPRYLHSTGQFHKGGPATGVYLQLVDDGMQEEEIPGGPNGFAALIAAQASGDRAVLEGVGRPVVTVARAELPALLAALDTA